jgi:hypothetical protein
MDKVLEELKNLMAIRKTYYPDEKDVSSLSKICLDLGALSVNKEEFMYPLRSECRE